MRLAHGCWCAPTAARAARLAVLSSVLTYALELEALRRLPARIYGVLMSLDPGIAALVGIVVLHEQHRLRAAVAIVL
jgi:inner membrane transporter RhtA